MNLSEVKVGDKLKCDCGSDLCVPFVVTNVSNAVITGVEASGDECYYTSDDMDKIRKLSKLEKALK